MWLCILTGNLKPPRDHVGVRYDSTSMTKEGKKYDDSMLVEELRNLVKYSEQLFRKVDDPNVHTLAVDR